MVEVSSHYPTWRCNNHAHCSQNAYRHQFTLDLLRTHGGWDLSLVVEYCGRSQSKQNKAHQRNHIVWGKGFHLFLVWRNIMRSSFSRTPMRLIIFTKYYQSKFYQPKCLSRRYTFRLFIPYLFEGVLHKLRISSHTAKIKRLRKEFRLGQRGRSSQSSRSHVRKPDLLLE